MTGEFRGRFYEDLKVGDVYRSHLGRTISETDNTWFTALTMNTNQVHFNAEFATRTEFGKPLVVSTLTLALVLGLSVRDTSENAGDTLWSESEVLRKRESRSRPSCGIVWLRTRGVNQRHETVIEFTRSFMVFKRNAVEFTGLFPAAAEPWRVGADSPPV